MNLTFFGGAKSVTGANYLIEHEGMKILVECGMFQGMKYVEDANYADFPYDPREIDFLFLTHGHIDHIGRVPKLIRDGYKGPIYASEPTVELAKVSLVDSAKIIKNEAKQLKRDPFFTLNDVKSCNKYWKKLKYGEMVDLNGMGKVQIFNAGHVLGSSMYRFKIGGKVLSFTGDLGNAPAPLIGPPDVLGTTDYLVIESAYGDREHEPTKLGAKYLKRLVIETINRGGVLMIPSFALERTQILLYYLNNLVENGEIPHVPIFVDSPLANNITKVYSKFEDYMKPSVLTQIISGDQIFEFPGLELTSTTEESKAINDVPPPKIIIAGSGMSTAGRILFHEKRYLPDPKNSILMAGYQVANTLGRRILDKKKKVKILGEQVEVKCDVHQISAFSAHADNPQLLKFVRENVEGKPHKIFVVQGEENAAEQLVFDLEELGYDAYAPHYKESFDL